MSSLAVVSLRLNGAHNGDWGPGENGIVFLSWKTTKWSKKTVNTEESEEIPERKKPARGSPNSVSSHLWRTCESHSTQQTWALQLMAEDERWGWGCCTSAVPVRPRKPPTKTKRAALSREGWRNTESPQSNACNIQDLIQNYSTHKESRNFSREKKINWVQLQNELNIGTNRKFKIDIITILYK